MLRSASQVNFKKALNPRNYCQLVAPDSLSKLRHDNYFESFLLRNTKEVRNELKWLRMEDIK